MPDEVESAMTREEGPSEPQFNRMIWGLFAVLGAMAASGVVGVIAMYANQAATNVRLQSIEASLVEMKQSLSERSKNVYSASDAAQDRATLQSQITSMRESWTLTLSKILDGNREEDNRISSLEVNQARMMERLYGNTKNGTPP